MIVAVDPRSRLGRQPRPTMVRALASPPSDFFDTAGYTGFEVADRHQYFISSSHSNSISRSPDTWTPPVMASAIEVR